MNKRLIGSLVMVAGFLSACASSQEPYPAASPPTAGHPGTVVRYPEGHYVLRGDGSSGAPYQWEWVQRPRASSPAPEARFAPSR